MIRIGPNHENKFKLIAVTLSIIIGLTASELMLKAADLPRFYKAHSGPVQFSFKLNKKNEFYYTNFESSEIEFVYDGNTRGYFDENNAVKHTTNSDGFRGPEFNKEKAEGVKRIAFIGDSFTFGEGVKDSDTFAYKVGEMLGDDYETYNFGVGGYNTQQSIELLKNTVLEFHPDIVILSYTLNDAEEALFLLDTDKGVMERRAREVEIHEGLADQKPADSLLFKFRTFRYIWQILNNKNLTDQTVEFYNNLYDENNRHWTATKESLHQFEQICTENNLECHFVLFPLLFQLNDDYPFTALHEKVLHEVNLDTIEIFPALKGKIDRELWVHPTDQHPNEIVHDIAAKMIFERLRQANEN